MAYAPPAQGTLASNEALQGIARKHGATAAQVRLKRLLGVAAIPKAQWKESQRANLERLQLRLNDEDRRKLIFKPRHHLKFHE